MSSTKLPEQQYRLTIYVCLPPYSCIVQRVDIVNPPDIICPDGDGANVSHRICIFLDNATKVAVNSSGGVQTVVPKSITWKLQENEYCETLMVSGNA